MDIKNKIELDSPRWEISRAKLSAKWVVFVFDVKRAYFSEENTKSESAKDTSSEEERKLNGSPPQKRKASCETPFTKIASDWSEYGSKPSRII